MPIKYARKKRVARKPARKTMSRRARVAKPTVSMVKTMVKKALDNRIENKTLGTTGTLSIFQAQNTTIINTFNLIPAMGQGTSESQRSGNQVKMKYCVLKGFMRYRGQGTNEETPIAPGQFHVRLFIGRLKQSILNPTASQLGELLRTGTVVGGFDSREGLSLVRPVNTEVFTVYYDKIFKVGAAGPANNNTTFFAASGLNNNDYKLNHIITIPLTKMIAKTWTYNDGALSPTNTGLFMWAGIVDAMASDYANINPLVQFDFDIKWSYEDA